MTARWSNWTWTINIFEVGSILTKIESFHTETEYSTIESFSQTTHRISVSGNDNLGIANIRDSGSLLEEEGQEESFHSHCFSSDGSLFAATHTETVHIWKYTSDGYARWREFPALDDIDDFRFSPTSSSLLGRADGILKLWRFDGPPADDLHGGHGQLFALSRCGGYVAVSHHLDSAIAIINLLSQTPPCVVDTGTEIRELFLTGNVLLALGCETIAAWRLTGEGMVDGVIPGGRAGCGNAIWTTPTRTYQWGVFIQDQTVLIEDGGKEIRAYHTETGEVLKLTQLSPRRPGYYWGTRLLGSEGNRRKCGWGTPSEGGGPLSRNTLREGWVKDLEGSCRLWLPVEWRNPRGIASRSHEGTIVWLSLGGGTFGQVIIKF
ncbi:hypothetical protein BDM02DRAFT_2504713 [Thelephora ganbajun]|uniref:Uncharacterized protein n=1 Tax=Thelephora ganbajun TaxID=370292 RepID=A0ACB6YY33_THEGA|nr:hypothetical protein BDM02DRAFT_2504713 [Thelephora ganbajun]